MATIRPHILSQVSGDGDADEDEGADSKGADDGDGVDVDDGDGVDADANDNLIERKSPAGAKHMCSICGDR